MTRTIRVTSALLLATLLVVLATLSCPRPGYGQPAPAGTRQPLIVDGKRTVVQRVLLRPNPTIFISPGASASHPGQGFTAFYVYARQTVGTETWLEIGAGRDGHTEGWVKSSQTLEWNHGMVAAFTSTATHARSLFMDTEAAAKALLDPDGAARAGQLRAEAIAGHPVAGVVALEPANFIDITHQFYLLPIIKATEVNRETGGPVRVLEVASAPDVRTPQPPGPDALANFRAGLVFVVDTTLSMQPYIDRTRDAMSGVIDKLRQTAVRDKFRFGVVAFRDSQAATPHNYEYTTKVFAQPDFAAPPEAVLGPMRSVVATTTDNDDFDEDPIAGIKTAIEKIDWKNMVGRYLVLITDAGGRESNDPKSTTHEGIDEMRHLAAENNVTMFVIHLLTPEGRAVGNHPHARRMYTQLTTNAGQTLYYSVDDGSQDKFQQTVTSLVSGLLGEVGRATGLPVAQLRDPHGGAPSRQTEQMEQQLRIVGEAMRLAYLGRVEQTTAPDIIRSFVLDRDPAPPGNLAVDVRVLLTRNQLDDLSRALDEILQAGRATRLDERAFFTQLQTALTLAARDPSRISQAGALGSLLNEYLEGLPYVSEIMGLTEREWQGMGPGEQARLLNNIDAKLRLYRDFNANPTLWKTLSGRPDAGDQVFPVPLGALP